MVGYHDLKERSRKRGGMPVEEGGNEQKISKKNRHSRRDCSKKKGIERARERSEMKEKGKDRDGGYGLEVAYKHFNCQ